MIACLILGGCSDPVCPDPLVRDSAGVQIVEHHAAQVNALGPQSWPRPDVMLGVAEGKPELEFSQLRSIAVLSDGRIVAADGASNELRVFGADGRHLRSLGGPGSGPGEFRRLSGAWVYGGDSILAFDAGLDRFTVLSADGGIARTYHPDPGNNLPYAPVAIFRDGSVLGVTARPLGGISGDGIIVDSSTLFVHGPEGALRDSVGQVFFMERWSRSSGIYNLVLRVPFGRTGMFAVSGELVCTGDGGHFEIRCRTDTGALSRIIRMAIPQVPVTSADIDSHFAQRSRGPSAAATNRLRHELPFPAHFPAFGLIAGTSAGELWVTGYRPPTHTEGSIYRFNASGRLAQRFAVQTDLQIASITPTHVYAVLRDEYGVERVARYPILRATSPPTCNPK